MLEISVGFELKPDFCGWDEMIIIWIKHVVLDIPRDVGISIVYYLFLKTYLYLLVPIDLREMITSVLKTLFSNFKY